MGTTKTSETTVNNTSTQQSTSAQTTPTATAQESELNNLYLQQLKAIQPQSTQLQQSAYNLGNLLLTGQNLPGYLSSLTSGVTAEQIPLSAGQFTEEMTSDVVKNALRDIYPQFQAMGLPIESGVAASVAGRTAGDIRRGVAESNLERELAIREANLNVGQTTQYQNINTLLNLLNLAIGGQAQIQQPVIATGNTLSQSLAGLRTINQTGTSTGTTGGTTTGTTSSNPFLESFYGTLGTTLGGGNISFGSGWFGM